MAGTPFWAQAPTSATTRSRGTATTARSGTTGRSVTEGYDVSPCTVLRVGFTGKTSPPNPASRQ